MYLTGFTDEAGADLATQIRATKELGWSHISARMIGSKNIHELGETEFNEVADTLNAEGIKVPEFGSLIGNWAKSIDTDFAITEAEIDRAIPRMQRLGTKLIRVMSYAQEPWGSDQKEDERFDRLRKIVARFDELGLTAVHENCMNWGGFSSEHTLRLVDEVPGLKLVFDTGNPVFQRDRSKGEPFPWQSALEFYQAIKEHIVHIHIKDAIMHAEEGEPEYTQAGEGQGFVKEILSDLKSSNYEGGIAIEPHIAKVFHNASDDNTDEEYVYRSYVEYGKNVESLLASC